MSIDTSGNARFNLPSPNLRGHVAQRTDNEGPNAVVRQEALGQSKFRDILIQSITQPATSATATDRGAPDTTGSSENTVPDQALANFVQDLFAALGRSTGNTVGMPLPPEGPGLTKEALTSSLEEAKSSDSNRYDRNLALLNNFDTADTDGNGAISHDEAHAFNEANSIPTIEGGVPVPPDQASVSQAYQPTFGAQMSANLQDLIQQLASVNESSTNGSSTATDAATPSASNPLLNSLETSYSNLVGAFGGDSSSGSLAHFLETLKGNLSSLGSAGNIVNTTA